VNAHVRERPHANRFLHRAYELGRTFERDYFSGRRDNFRKIDGCIARASADIEHAAASGDAGLLPAIQNHRPPDSMLQAQSHQFLVVRTKDVIAFRIHDLAPRFRSQARGWN